MIVKPHSAGGKFSTVLRLLGGHAGCPIGRGARHGHITACAEKLAVGRRAKPPEPRCQRHRDSAGAPERFDLSLARPVLGTPFSGAIPLYDAGPGTGTGTRSHPAGNRCAGVSKRIVPDRRQRPQQRRRGTDTASQFEGGRKIRMVLIIFAAVTPLNFQRLVVSLAPCFTGKLLKAVGQQGIEYRCQHGIRRRLHFVQVGTDPQDALPRGADRAVYAVGAGRNRFLDTVDVVLFHRRPLLPGDRRCRPARRRLCGAAVENGVRQFLMICARRFDAVRQPGENQVLRIRHGVTPPTTIFALPQRVRSSSTVSPESARAKSCCPACALGASRSQIAISVTRA